jgi:membrane protein
MTDLLTSVEGTPTPTSRSLGRQAWQLAGRRALHGFMRHRGIDSSATLAFFAALTVFPASLTIVSAFALIDDRAHASRDILTVVESVASKDTADAVRGPLNQLLSIPSPGIALAIGLVLTLWSLSNYVTAFGRSVNVAYEVEEGRQWGLLRLAMIGVAAVLMLALGLIIVLLLGTPTVAADIAKTNGLPPAAAIVWDVAKWPVIAVLAIVLVATLYYYSPNVRHLRIRWVTWGALAAIVVWVLATTGFAFYVLNISHYNKVYGWLGGAIVLLLWLYLSNYVVVFGAEVDAEIVRVRQLEAGIEAETVIQLPLRSTHRNLILARHLADDERRGRELREESDRDRRSSGSAEGAETDSESDASDDDEAVRKGSTEPAG